MTDFDFESRIVDIPDYPEPGVVFKDITPLFDDPEALRAVVDSVADHFANAGITKVVGAEARGFLVGAPVAYRLGCGFVPARKPGKLPREVFSQSYSLEYGTDEIQIHKDALTSEDRVLIVDDLVATGGTAIASAQLVEQSGAAVAGFAFILELSFLKPRHLIAEKYPQEVFSLVKVG
ncbi:adenine phosphoribosyltransferase [Thermophilibacter provencensis]|uniref:Adenine phosphoribosyltransferase n=1 Tax=Thermophilibacter provencensis TaxID=1852386 RepID=A0ABT7V326_9ACTN|nr:adenine phosphoribosyltransferase [Thermophilibacter provencensis]MDM8271000.1 adenine phosphoribosyltransferase [Thermophilibacter provencensis]